MWGRRPKAEALGRERGTRAGGSGFMPAAVVGLVAGLALSLPVVLGGPVDGSVGSPGAGEPAVGVALAPAGASRGVAGGGSVVGVASASAARRGLGSLPVAAQAAVSATLGARSSAFSARRSSGGYRLGGGGVAARLGARGAGAACRRSVVVDGGCGCRSRRQPRPGWGAVCGCGREPRLARPRCADGVVRGRPAGDRAGLHALPPSRRNDRAGHARVAVRGRRACASGRIRDRASFRAGAGRAELRSAFGDRRERAPAPRGARGCATAFS